MIRAAAPPAYAGPSPTEPATRAELLEPFGERDLSVQSLFQFVFVPPGRLGYLAELARDEDWGAKSYVLLRYLALHLPLELEQGRYAWNGEQLVCAAGRLCTAAGAPIYVGLVRNANVGENPWVLNWVGERPNCGAPPEPASLGEWPTPTPGAEVLIAFDPADPERRTQLAGLVGVGPIARHSALSGAIAWALHRGLAVRQLHGGARGFFVPIFLSQREDLTLAPDHVVPIVAQAERVVARTLLDTEVAYAPARAVVERWEQLPTWLLDGWDIAQEGSASDGTTAS